MFGTYDNWRLATPPEYEYDCYGPDSEDHPTIAPPSAPPTLVALPLDVSEDIADEDIPF